jgi:hypothetical protein
MPVPLAPIQEQDELLRTLQIREAAIETIACASHSAFEELNTLDQSILAKAFRGELVPQDKADEPASVLLERIRSGPTKTKPTTRSIQRGRVKFYILLLLRTWKKALSCEMLERGLVLMLNDTIRRAILGRTSPAKKRSKKPGSPSQYVVGLDALFGEMLDDGQLIQGSEPGFFAEGDHQVNFDMAPKPDLDAVRETAEAMKLIKKENDQALEAEFASELNGEVYELVS